MLDDSLLTVNVPGYSVLLDLRHQRTMVPVHILRQTHACVKLWANIDWNFWIKGKTKIRDYAEFFLNSCVISGGQELPIHYPSYIVFTNRILIFSRAAVYLIPAEGLGDCEWCRALGKL